MISKNGPQLKSVVAKARFSTYVPIGQNERGKKIKLTITPSVSEKKRFYKGRER